MISGQHFTLTIILASVGFCKRNMRISGDVSQKKYMAYLLI